MAKITQLEALANQFRPTELAINRYSANNGYGITNPNAVSDGDEFGKGQKGENGTVGSMTDIQTRIATVTKNAFGENNKYPDFQ